MTIGGNEYIGALNTTISGLACTQWSSVNNSLLWNDLGLLNAVNYQQSLNLEGEDHNYCRNPLSVRETPWCFLDLNGSQTWEYCEVPICGKSFIKSYQIS